MGTSNTAKPWAKANEQIFSQLLDDKTSCLFIFLSRHGFDDDQYPKQFKRPQERSIVLKQSFMFAYVQAEKR